VEVSPVDSSGLVDVERMSSIIQEGTRLVSIMVANNEIGVLQPIAEIAAICQSRGVIFHSDAAQAVGKIPVDVKALGVDLMSLSGHKLYAPVGIGALYLSDECPIIPEPIAFGGGQERGIRSGTISPVLCVALGAAAAIAEHELAADAELAARLRSRFLEIVRARTAGKFIRLNSWSTTLPEKGAFTRTELHLAAFVGG
jgi:cysteine desulfurase